MWTDTQAGMFLMFMDVEKLKRSNLRWLKAEKLNHYLVFEFISKIMAFDAVELHVWLVGLDT